MMEEGDGTGREAKKGGPDHEMWMFEVLGRLMQSSHPQYCYYDNGPSHSFDPYNTFDS